MDSLLYIIIAKFLLFFCDISHRKQAAFGVYYPRLTESPFNMKNFFKKEGCGVEITAYLKQIPFTALATEEEFQLMAQSAYITTFAKGEVVHTRSQTECLGLVLVISGSLCASMISDEGKQILLYRLSRGEMCLFMARCVLNLLSYDAVVEGEKAGSMLVIPKAATERVMQNILVENAMNRLALQRCSQIMGALERVLFARVDKRLASCLLQEAESRGGREVKLTHEQLARDISSAREVVSRVLGKFAADGLISLHRGLIVIEDPDRLRGFLK